MKRFFRRLFERLQLFFAGLASRNGQKAIEGPREKKRIPWGRKRVNDPNRSLSDSGSDDTYEKISLSSSQETKKRQVKGVIGAYLESKRNQKDHEEEIASLTNQKGN